MSPCVRIVSPASKNISSMVSKEESFGFDVSPKHLVVIVVCFSSTISNVVGPCAMTVAVRMLLGDSKARDPKYRPDDKVATCFPTPPMPTPT